MVGDPQRVHCVLGVVAVAGGQLPCACRVPLAEEAPPLGVDVAQERTARAAGDKRRRQRLQLTAELPSFEDIVPIDEEQ